MCRCADKNAKGFTLAEAMVATVVLAIAAAGVLMPFVAGTSVRVEGQRRMLAAKLAGDLMEQIINTIKTDPNEIVTPWSYSETQGQVTDATEAVFSDPAYSSYSREAACVEVYVNQEEGYYDPVGADAPIFLCATVKVYYNGRETASVSRLIAK
jgi:prepilin-type N-terminal cleavage/methylation domain-containing protein